MHHAWPNRNRPNRPTKLYVSTRLSFGFYNRDDVLWTRRYSNRGDRHRKYLIGWMPNAKQRRYYKRFGF